MKRFFVKFRNPYNSISLLIITIGLIIFLVNCFKLWSFIIDDSFITFRYSNNFIEGIGPTFNASLPRAEGYTSFLWMLLMSFPHLINFGVVSFSKILGIMSIFGTALVIFLFIKDREISERESPKIAAGIVIFFYFVLPETAVHAISGMETSLFTFLFIFFTWQAYIGLHKTEKALFYLPLIGLLTGLTRPESNLTVILMYLILIISITKKRWFAQKLFFLYLLPGVIYFIWRWLYYDLFLPLPFYIKAESGNFQGYDYVSSFVLFILTNFIFFLAFGFFGNRRKLLVTSLQIAINLFLFLFISPIMGYDFRFVYPILPSILVITGLGINQLLRIPLFNTKVKRKLLGLIWISLIILVIFSWNNIPRSNNIIFHKLDYSNGLTNNHIRIGKILSTIDNQNTLVVTDAGALPYYSGWNTIDAIGLNDPIIALDNEDKVNYIYSKDPEIVILTSNSLTEYVSDSKYYRDLFGNAMSEGMVVISKTETYQGDSMWVLGNPSSEIYEELRYRLGTQP